MATTDENSKMRIGEVAEQAGTTPRTIRYYEELGLLGDGEEREHGKHRCYTESDVERVRELVMLKDLLGLSLEQLAEVVENVSARALIRTEYHKTEDPGRRRDLLEAAVPHLRRQLELVQERRDALTNLEQEITERLNKILGRLADLS
ncbi:MAG: MerR family transcriptional regulator [Solirubrobacterales bacterium]|nr:MerR family transcriptional regulator [Solirubrobacterales bacterium]